MNRIPAPDTPPATKEDGATALWRRVALIVALALGCLVLAAPDSQAQYAGGLPGFFQHLFGVRLQAAAADRRRTQPPLRERAHKPVRKRTGLRLVDGHARARHAGRRARGQADLLRFGARRQPGDPRRSRPDGRLRRQAGSLGHRSRARHLWPGARRLLRLAEGGARPPGDQAEDRRRRDHARHQRPAAVQGQRRDARHAERQVARRLRPADRRAARAVPRRPYSGPLGGTAADARRAASRPGPGAERNVSRPCRQGRRNLRRYLGRLLRSERAVRRLRARRRRPERQIAQRRRAESISPRPDREKWPSSSSRTSGANSTRTSRRAIWPRCLRTSRRKPPPSTPRFSARRAPSAAIPGLGESGAGPEAIGWPDRLPDRPARLARRRSHQPRRTMRRFAPPRDRLTLRLRERPPAEPTISRGRRLRRRDRKRRADCLFGPNRRARRRRTSIQIARDAATGALGPRG